MTLVWRASGMAPWQFKLDLSTKPLVLAGPILRKVSKASTLLNTKDSVTVWFALQKAATVTLTVFDSSGTPVLTGETKTTAVGRNLHIVAVTADQPVPVTTTKLAENAIFSYDASFQLDGAPQPPLIPTLAAATLAKPATATDPGDLTYEGFTRPTFCLPPSDINRLRLIHGSCRHANGEDSKDGLALLDGLIRETAKDPSLRPHQLFMTGDQIYADDVAAAQLMMLTAASDQLLGWTETLPLPKGFGGATKSTKVKPYARYALCIESGFTSDQGHNHLFSLGEYICSYLFAWSDVLWSDNDIPTTDQAISFIGEDVITRFELYTIGPTGRYARSRSWVKDHIGENIKYLRQFRTTVHEIRRALANIPTYMIMDDHDITDDFHMTRRICEDVYGGKGALGQRVITNGLVAYALCQHWGNAPEQFTLTSQGAGFRLLGALDKGGAETYETLMPNIMQLVGVHGADKMRNPPAAAVGPDRTNVFAAFHDPGSFVFDYTVECDTHQVIVTDTRTWRSFPNGPDAEGVLLPNDQIQRQIVNAGRPTGNRTLFVVVTTNAPPVPGIRFTERHDTVTTIASRIVLDDRHPDVLESWALPSEPFDRLMRGISERLPLVNNVRTGAAIILSGDVHHSFATRLRLKGTARFGDAVAQPVNMVAVQLVASSFRNPTGLTLSLHTDGYAYPWYAPTEPVIRGYIGWNVPKGTKTVVAKGSMTIGNFGSSSVTLDLKGSKTVTVEPGLITDDEQFGLPLRLTVTPNWAYKLEYLRASDRDKALPAFAKTPLPKPLKGDEAGQRVYFRNLSGNYDAFVRHTAAGRDIVGVTNICEVRVDTANNTVFQTVRWNDPHNNNLVTITTYQASLATTDSLADALPNVGWAP